MFDQYYQFFGASNASTICLRCFYLEHTCVCYRKPKVNIRLGFYEKKKTLLSYIWWIMGHLDKLVLTSSFSVLQVDICCFDKTGTLTSDDMVCREGCLFDVKKWVSPSFSWAIKLISDLLQEFRGVVGLSDSMDLEVDMTKVPSRIVEILASCHALVFVDNKLVG